MKGQLQPIVHDTKASNTSTSSTSSGMFSYFKSLTAGRVITAESIGPVMDKMKEHLISEWVWLIGTEFSLLLSV